MLNKLGEIGKYLLLENWDRKDDGSSLWHERE